MFTGVGTILPEFISCLSPWAEHKPHMRMSETLPSFSKGEISEACNGASRITLCISKFRHDVRKKFPHRVDAIAVADKAEQTLCDQHGGMDPFLLYKLDFNELGELSSPEERTTLEKVCRRWMNRDELCREFWIFHPFDRKRFGRSDLLTEEKISEIKTFLEGWIRDQKNRALFD